MHCDPEAISECRAVVLSPRSRELVAPVIEVRTFDCRPPPSRALVVAVWSTRAALAVAGVSALVWSFRDLPASMLAQPSVSVARADRSVPPSSTPDEVERPVMRPIMARYASLQFGDASTFSEGSGLPSRLPHEIETRSLRAEPVPRTDLEPSEEKRRGAERQTRSRGLHSSPAGIRQPSAPAPDIVLPTASPRAISRMVASSVAGPEASSLALVVLPTQKPADLIASKPRAAHDLTRRLPRRANSLAKRRRADRRSRRRTGSSFKRGVRAFHRDVDRSLRRAGRSIHRGISRLF